MKQRLFQIVARSSNWFDTKFTAAGRLVVLTFIVAAIFGLDPRQTSAYQLAAVLAAALIVAAVFSFRWRGRVTVKRTLPKYVTVGEPASYALEVHNHTVNFLTAISVHEKLLANKRPWSRAGRGDRSVTNWFDRKIGFIPWLNELRRSRGANLDAASIGSLAPRDTVKVTQTLTATRRGAITFAETELRQGEALGLMRSHTRIPKAEKIIALPERFALPNLNWSSRRNFHRGGVNLASAVGDSKEFISLRDYRPGDPLQQIHWKSFAKRGKPVVKEFQDEYFDHHALVLDTQLEVGNEDLLEGAISVAASFAHAPQPNDSLLDLVMIGGDSWQLTTGRGVNDKSQLLEHLALVQADGAVMHPALYEQMFKKLKHCSAVIYICCTWDSNRKHFVERLKLAGVSCLPLCIVRDSNNAADHYELEANSIASQLLQILLRKRNGI